MFRHWIVPDKTDSTFPSGECRFMINDELVNDLWVRNEWNNNNNEPFVETMSAGGPLYDWGIRCAFDIVYIISDHVAPSLPSRTLG